MSSYFTITSSVSQSDNKLKSFTSFRHKFCSLQCPWPHSVTNSEMHLPAKPKAGLKTIIFSEGKKKKDQNQQRKAYLTSQLRRFFCSDTKMISDKGSFLPTHCIQKERSHAHHYCRQGLEDALSSLYLHYISPAGWYMCRTSNAVPIAYLDGATYSVPTRCCFPVPPSTTPGFTLPHNESSQVPHLPDPARRNHTTVKQINSLSIITVQVLAPAQQRWSECMVGVGFSGTTSLLHHCLSSLLFISPSFH